MSFDFTDYLHGIIDDFDDTSSKYYINTTAKYPSKKSQNPNEYGDTLTALFQNISENKNTLLIGKPGLGKSTALKLLCFQQAERCLSGVSSKIPVLIELRRVGGKSNFAEETVTLFKLIQSKLFSTVPSDERQVSQLLKSGKLLLLLDGLNEMPSTSRGLNDFILDHPNALIVITTREFGHNSHIKIDHSIHLQPLGEHQSHEFIKKRLRESQASVDELLKLKNGKLQELLSTPLFLDMLCKTYQLSGHAPSNIGELFRRFTEIHYSNHKPSTTITPRADDFFDFCHEILQELAFLMIHADGHSLRLQISKTEAQKWLEHRFAERGEASTASKAKQWLDDAVRLHLLQQTEDGEAIEFIHQVFQEYYAAEWILRHYEDLSDDQMMAHYFNPIKWTESILILAGLLGDRLKVLIMLKMAVLVDLAFAAKLSGRVKDEFQCDAFAYIKGYVQNEANNPYTVRSILKHNQTKFWADFLIDYLENPQKKKINIGGWFDHCNSLIRVNCERTKGYFRSILNDKGTSKEPNDQDKVNEALRSLIELGDTESVISFIVSKTPKPTSGNIERAINHLGDVRDEKHAPLLISLFDNEDFDSVSLFWIITALGEIDSETATNKLLEIFKSESVNSDRRSSAIRALRDSSNKKILPDMLKAVIIDGNFAESATHYIKRTDFSYGEDWLLSELKKRATMLSRWSLSLATLLHNATKELAPKYIDRKYAWNLEEKIVEAADPQINLVTALGYLGSKKSTPFIKKLYRSHYWQIRRASIFAIGRIACPDDTTFLIKALQDKHDWVKDEAIDALGWMPDPIATNIYLLERIRQQHNGHDRFCRLISEMQDKENYNLDLVLTVFESGENSFINNMVSVLWNSRRGLVYTEKLIEVMVHRMNHTDTEMGEYICRFLSHVNKQQKSANLDLALKQFDKPTKAKPNIVKPAGRKSNNFSNINNIAELFDILYKPSNSGKEAWEEKRDATDRIKQIAKIDDLPVICKYAYDQGNTELLHSIQSHLGFYNADWCAKADQLAFLSSTQYRGSTVINNSYNNFNDKVISCAIDSPNATINN